uniref:DUF834 domain-containing protein n=1 Tax=Oryza barthii TaxID=65489 RepID=A0A0D3FMF3_9ORYZ
MQPPELPVFPPAISTAAAAAGDRWLGEARSQETDSGRRWLEGSPEWGVAAGAGESDGTAWETAALGLGEREGEKENGRKGEKRKKLGVYLGFLGIFH